MGQNAVEVCRNRRPRPQGVFQVRTHRRPQPAAVHGHGRHLAVPAVM